MTVGEYIVFIPTHGQSPVQDAVIDLHTREKTPLCSNSGQIDNNNSNKSQKANIHYSYMRGFFPVLFLFRIQIAL